MQLRDPVSQLRAAVEREFGAMPRPTASQIVSGDCEESDEVRERLSGRRFTDVSDESLDWLNDCLPFLGPEGLQYYLPAYLLRALREPQWHGTPMLLIHLDPTNAEEYWRDRVAVFTPPQRAVIIQFLDALRSDPEATSHIEVIDRARRAWHEAA